MNLHLPSPGFSFNDERMTAAIIADIERVNRTSIVICNMDPARAALAVQAGKATGYPVTVTNDATDIYGNPTIFVDHVRVSIDGNGKPDHSLFWREYERLTGKEPTPATPTDTTPILHGTS